MWKRADGPPSSDELQLRVQVAEEGRDLRADQLDRRDRANGDDSDQEPVLDQVLAVVFTQELENEILHFTLLQLRIQVAEEGRDLRADQLDRRDRADGDDPHEQAVLDQVLARILTNETHENILHL